MTIDEFLVELQDVLQSEEDLSIDRELSSLEEWDSMAVMACMVWLEKQFGVKYPFNTITQFKTIGDIVNASNKVVA